MPYQGSAQSVGFRNRTVIDPSKRMREEAQLIQEQGRERLRGMETQASQLTQEAQRVSDLQASNSRYELQALSQFSKTINTFMEDVVVEEVKKKNEEEYAKEVIAYRTQGPEVLQQISEEVDQTLKKSQEVDVKLENLAQQAPTEEAAEKVRAVSKTGRTGYEFAALNEAGQNFGVHLVTELDTNVTQIKDPATGKFFVLKDAQTRSEREAARQHIVSEYIKTHRGNFSAKVLVTKFLPQIDQALQFERKDFEQRYRVKYYNEQFDALKNNLFNGMQQKEGFVKDSSGITHFLKVGAIYLEKLGIANPKAQARKELLQMATQMIKTSPDPDATAKQVWTLFKETIIPDHAAGPKSLVDLYSSEFNENNFNALAIEAKLTKFNADQSEQAMYAQQEYDDLLVLMQSGQLSQVEKNRRIQEFETNFPTQSRLIAGLKTWQPAILGVQASQEKMEALKAQYGGEIPKSEIDNIDPTVLEQYQNNIVDQPFGTGQKEAQDQAKALVTASIREVRKAVDSNTVLQDDALRARNAGWQMIMPLARKLHAQAKAAGEPISEGEAIQLAGSQIADNIEADQKTKGRFYAAAGDGFVNFEQEQGGNFSPTLHRQNLNYRRAQNLLTQNSKALLTTKIITNPLDLEPMADGRPKPFIYRLARLSGQHSPFEVLNAQRKLAGKPPVPIPEAVKAAEARLRRSPAYRKMLSRPSHRNANLLLQENGIISPATMLKALGFKESGGNYRSANRDPATGNHLDPALGKYQMLWSNVVAWSKQYGFSHPGSQQNFLNSPKYQESLARAVIQEYIRQAVNASKGDINQAIRRVAAFWYGGTKGFENWDSPTYGLTRNRDGTVRYPSMRGYTTDVLNYYRGS